jgi:hypothetical protein
MPPVHTRGIPNIAFDLNVETNIDRINVYYHYKMGATTNYFPIVLLDARNLTSGVSSD